MKQLIHDQLHVVQSTAGHFDVAGAKEQPVSKVASWQPAKESSNKKNG
ncbi:MAG: hypothetical protein AB7K37_10625 [Cyclobacteriaceae bacterium]